MTLQGHPIYYNKALYEKAGLDPDEPAHDLGASSSATAPPSPKATGATCFALGNKEGIGIQFFLSGLGSGILTPQEYDDWIAGKRDWTSPNVKRIFELWKDADDTGLNNDGANSTAMFNDAFARLRVRQGRAHHRADVGHRALEGLRRVPRRGQVGVMPAPVVTDGATPSLPYDGGIGYAVAKWTKDPKLAADLVRSLTSTDALTAFYADAGAIASDTTIDVSGGGPAVAAIVPRDQDRQARAARRAVLQDHRPDGTAVPAAARAVRSPSTRR